MRIVVWFLIIGLACLGLLFIAATHGHAQALTDNLVTTTPLFTTTPPPPPVIVIPYGGWLGGFVQEIIVPLLPILWMLFIAVLSWLANKFAGPYAKQIVAVLNDKRVQDAAMRAVDYGFGAVANATKDKTMTVTDTNSVLDAAVAYAVKNEPAFVHWAGESIRAYIYAHMAPLTSVPASAGSAKLGLPAAATAVAPTPSEARDSKADSKAPSGGGDVDIKISPGSAVTGVTRSST